MNSQINVIGSGAWGTALAVLFARAGKNVVMWARNPEIVAEMATWRIAPRLPNVVLPENLQVTAQMPERGTSLVVVPTQHLRALAPRLPQNGPLILCCKGLEIGSLLLPPEFVSGQQIAVLTGPNFAHEVAAGLPAAAVLATPDEMLRGELIKLLKTDSLRLYGSPDMLGAALGGAAKNVLAIAAGVVMGAGLGENARAALITRGLAEIGRLAQAIGGRAETISGLSGLGDLLLTCTGPSSRNYSLGFALGKGESLAAVLQQRTSVTEGVTTAPALLTRAQKAGIEMPITEAVTRLLTQERTVSQTMVVLMGRALKDE